MGFSARFRNTFRGLVVGTRFPLALICALVLGGCSGSPQVEPAALQTLLDDAHREDSFWLKVLSVDVRSTEAIPQTQQVRATYAGQYKLLEDMCEPMTLAEAYELYQFDERQIEDAGKRAADLRSPERETAVASRPMPRRFANLYRLAGRRDTTYDLQGTARLESAAPGWTLVDITLPLPTELADRKLVRRSKLPQDAVVIGDAKERNPLADYIDQHRQFRHKVEQEERTMNERLEREHRDLLAASVVGRSWRMKLLGVEPAKQIRLTIVERTEDAAAITALIADVENPLERAVWIGALALPPLSPARGVLPRGATHDGWTITFRPARDDSTFPVSGGLASLIMTPTADGIGLSFPVGSVAKLLRDDAAPKISDAATLAKRLAQWTAPGRVWEGLYKQPNVKSEPVRLTFTEVREQGGYVRAVLETTSDLSLMSVWEGSIGTSAADLYGHPIRLRRNLGRGVSGKHLLFGNEYSLGGAQLPLLLQEGERPALLAPGLELGLAEPIAEFQSNRKQWEQTLAPGAQWSGKLRFGDIVPLDITVTVAETRDEFSYVRLVMEDQKVRTRVRVFEGTLERADAQVDEYALTVSGPAATQATHHGSAFYNDAFGLDAKNVHRFRLSPDGKSLYFRSELGEFAVLTRDKSSPAFSLEVTAAAAHWRRTVVKGARWRGKLFNTEFQKSTDVELEVLSDLDDDGDVRVGMRVPAMPKLTIEFDGLVRLVTPQHSNAFALELKKKAKGVESNSPVFGWYVGNQVHFRLAMDGTTLHGYSGGIGGALSSYVETMELRPAPATAP